MKISKAFLLQQTPMIYVVGRTFFQTIFPFLKTAHKDPLAVEEKTVSPPSQKLVAAYNHWVGVKEGRYNGLSPHMFCQYALPFGLNVLNKLKYPLAKIINQGVNIEVYNDISGTQPIHLETGIVDVKEENGRARVHQKMTISEDGNPKCIVIDLYVSFIIGRGKRKREKKKEINIEEYKSIGKWSVNKEAGLEFAILSGDLNPLHWVDFIAQKTPFKGTILHGFGMYTKVFEMIQNTQNIRLKKMEVKFIKPVKLPSENLEVKVMDTLNEEGEYELVLLDKRGEKLMIGTFL